MKKKILFGSLIAVVILILVSIAPSINANVSKPDNEVKEDDVLTTPITMVLQLINKLRNHKDIENVETEDDVLQIIEGDGELNSIFEQLSGNDCDCEDDNPTWERIWPFPIICVLLVPFAIFSFITQIMTGWDLLANIVGLLALIFNCNWA